MSKLQTGGFDPNSKLTEGKELALVVRSAQELQNKYLVPGHIGQITESLQRAALNVSDQVQRMPALTSDDLYAKAGALLQSVKQMIKQSDLERKTITSPILALKKAVDDAFSAVADKALHDAKIAIEERMLAYAKAKAAEREAKAAAERAALLAEADRIAKESANKDLAQVVAEIADAVEKHPTVPIVESHGVRTQVRTYKQVNVTDLRVALAHILKSATAAELSSIVSLNARALRLYATRMSGGELTVGPLEGGLEVTESDVITNF